MASLIDTPGITPEKLPPCGLPWLRTEKSLLQTARFTDMQVMVEAEERRGKRLPKNREMKEEPTMLLITKDRRFPSLGLAAHIGPKNRRPARVKAYFGCYPSARRPGPADIAKGPSCRKKFNERSQEIYENKGDRFITNCKSQEVYENKGVIFVKPRGY
jgi:hypothetical protein